MSFVSSSTTQTDLLSAQSQTARQRAQFRLAIVVLVLASFAWRVQGLDFQSLWRDEVDAIYFALRDLPRTLAMFVDAGQNGPLYFLTLRPWFHIVGSSEIALRLPSVFAGVASIPLLCQVAVKLFGANVGLWVRLLPSLFFALNPYQLWYSQEGKMYALITALTLAATWCWLHGIEEGGWRIWLSYLVIVSLAIYTHLFMILLIPLHLLWLFIAWPPNKRSWFGYGGALAGLTLPYLPMLWWQWDLLMAAEKRTGFSFVPLDEMLKTLALNHSFGFTPQRALIWLSPLALLAFMGVLLGWCEMGSTRLSSWRRYLLILTWLWAPIFEIYLLSLRQPVYTDRYIIWIAPAAALLLALGAKSIYTALDRRSGLVFTASLCLYIAGFWLHTGWEQKTNITKFDLRSAVRTVYQQRSADSLLLLQIPHLQWAYRYYSSNQGAAPFADAEVRLGHWAEGLWTNGVQSDQQARSEAESQMQRITANGSDVWVIFSEVEMWDRRRLMEEWLTQHGQLLEQQAFYGVEVRRYRLIYN
jgi:4-amino-4-deoxy-L-arabinose transferase-like glycosyltransferase